jgi:hypothetical protein
MKIKCFGIIFLALLALTGIVSCASTPQPVEEPQPQPAPQPEPAQPQPPAAEPDRPDQASLNALDAAVLNTDNARKLVLDFNGNTFFPQEWQSAEGLRTRAEGLGRNTQTAVNEAIPLFNQAADAYDALAVKTIPAYKDDLETKVLAARDNAIKEGAGYYAPEYLWKADSLADQALAQYEAKDYYKAKDTGLLLLDSYNAITVGLQAYKLRLEMDYLGFYAYDSAALDAADEMGYSACDDYMAGNVASAATKATNVLALYEQCYTAHIQTVAHDLGLLATAERNKAREVKANVAVRQDFNTAHTLLVQGVNAENDRNFKLAALDYAHALEMFKAATALTLVKRQQAENAIRQAELKLAESDEAAYRAEMLIRGGTR